MANPEVSRVVDELIRSGRVTENLRSEYEGLIEKGLGDHLLRGADYTKKTQALADDRRQAESWLQAERQKIQDERNRLGQWEGQVRKDLDEYNRVMKEIPDLKAQMAAYQQTLSDYQILDKVNLPAKPANVEPPRQFNPPQQFQPPVQDKNYMTKEEADAFASNFFTLNSKIRSIDAQHQRLFGEPLEENLAEHYLRTGEDPENYWRVKYGVDGKRADIESKNREAYEAKIREEERAKILKEYSMDPSRVVGSPSGPKGGLSPLLETYSGSRALEHSKNHANDNAAAPPRDEFVPPEKRSIIAMDRERISNASKMYLDHFDLDGNPTSEQGKTMFRKHFVGDQY